MDGDQTDVPVAQFGANAAHSLAALVQRNVFVFRHQQGSVEVLGLKGGHDSPGDFPVVGPLEETAVGVSKIAKIDGTRKMGSPPKVGGEVSTLILSLAALLCRV